MCVGRDHVTPHTRNKRRPTTPTILPPIHHQQRVTATSQEGKPTRVAAPPIIQGQFCIWQISLLTSPTLASVARSEVHCVPSRATVEVQLLGVITSSNVPVSALQATRSHTATTRFVQREIALCRRSALPERTPRLHSSSAACYSLIYETWLLFAIYLPTNSAAQTRHSRMNCKTASGWIINWEGLERKPPCSHLRHYPSIWPLANPQVCRSPDKCCPPTDRFGETQRRVPTRSSPSQHKPTARPHSPKICTRSPFLCYPL
jgi:hypothetical protein